jgi:hypothetical protein
MGLLLSSLLLPPVSHGEETSNTKKRGAFFQAQPVAWNFTGGGFLGNHRVGLYTNSGVFTYRSLGLEYAYHIHGVTNNGFYGKIFAEHRKYDPGLQVNSRYVEEGKSGHWEQDILDHHTDNHYGVLIGYQWLFASPHFYMQAGLGWQYNDNPVNIGPTLFGFGADIKARQTATGELAFGYLFY